MPTYPALNQMSSADAATAETLESEAGCQAFVTSKMVVVGVAALLLSV